MDFNAICPLCKEMILADINASGCICGNCGKSVYVPAAMLAFEHLLAFNGIEEYYPPKTAFPYLDRQELAALPPSPVDDFEIDADGTLTEYRGNGGAAVIPNSVKRIGADSFSFCKSLTSVFIPQGVTTIGNSAFSGCSSLTTVIIPQSVTDIGVGAFEHCDELSTLTVTEGNPFYHSSGNCIIETATKTLIASCKTGVIPFDGSVTRIGERAFAGRACHTLSVTPNFVKKLGIDALVGRFCFKNIFIPDSVTSIESEAFADC